MSGSNGLARARVAMIVEDEPVFRALLGQLVEMCGMEAILVRDGMEALGSFDPGAIDILITDLKMPRLDGVSLLEHLRPLAPDMPMIAITASDMDEALVKKAGANSVIHKPFHLEDLAPLLK
jgi:CheY-like chemotaxis protein